MLGKNAARATLMLKFCGDQLGLGGGDVGAAGQQLRRQAGSDRRQAQRGQRARADGDALGRLAGQDAEADDLLLQLADEVGDQRALAGDQGFLLGDIQLAGGAGVEAAADHRQGLFGVGEVAAGDVRRSARDSAVNQVLATSVTTVSATVCWSKRLNMAVAMADWRAARKRPQKSSS